MMNKLTDCLHVFIKVLAGNQSPGANKLLNHGDDEDEDDDNDDDKTQTSRSALPIAGTRRRRLRSRAHLRI